MAEAIECAHTAIVCVSREYKVSANCRLEANYINQRASKGLLEVIYVMMEEDYTTVSEPEAVDGYLGLMIGGSLWYPLWDEQQITPSVGSIVDYMSKYYDKDATGKDGEAVARHHSASVSAPKTPTHRNNSISLSASSGNIAGALAMDAKMDEMVKRMASLEQTVETTLDMILTALRSGGGVL